MPRTYYVQIAENNMTEGEALNLAKQATAEKNWPWIEPVRIAMHRRFFVGRMTWRIHTNQGQRGRNVRIEIDDNERRVVKAAFCPR